MAILEILEICDNLEIYSYLHSQLIMKIQSLYSYVTI